jgi:hypothetical protein
MLFLGSGASVNDVFHTFALKPPVADRNAPAMDIVAYWVDSVRELD